MKKYSIIHELSSKQIDQLLGLFKQMWWTKGRTDGEVATMLKNSMSFGMVEQDSYDLVGYARVLTDEIKYAFIFDVMLAEHLRGRGLGKVLMDAIIAHPRLKNIKNFELTCAPDMVGFYERFGFREDYGLEVRPMRLSKK
jgi:predicted GNAT family N-acyltransferase